MYISSPNLSYRDLLIEGLTTELDPAFSNSTEIKMEAFFSPPEDKFPAFFLLPDKIILNYGLYDNQRLYFDEQAANYEPLPYDGAPYTFVEEERFILAEFADKTNQELQNEYNMSFGGAILPDDAQTVVGIEGGKIRTWQNDPLNLPVCINAARENNLEVINACLVAAGSDKVAGPLPNYDHPTGNCSLTSSTEHELFDREELSAQIFPNPTTGMFQIVTDLRNYNLSIFAISGRLITEMNNLNGTSFVDAAQWQNGIYFLRFIDNTTQQTKVMQLVKVD